MLKIRRPLGRLIFNMGIAIPDKTIFLIEMAPSMLREQSRWSSAAFAISQPSVLRPLWPAASDIKRSLEKEGDNDESLAWLLRPFDRLYSLVSYTARDLPPKQLMISEIKRAFSGYHWHGSWKNLQICQRPILLPLIIITMNHLMRYVNIQLF